MPNGRRLGVRRAQRILKEIDRTRKLTVDQFLGSLGIQHLGKRRTQQIREAWAAHISDEKQGDEVENWFTSKHDNYSLLVTHAMELGIPNIATEIQSDIDAKYPLIKELLQYITIAWAKAPVEADTSHAMSGKSVCFSGVRPDQALQDRMISLGIETKSGVSKGLDILVLKDPSSTSSKAQKARNLSVQIIGFNEFKEIISGT